MGHMPADSVALGGAPRSAACEDTWRLRPEPIVTRLMWFGASIGCEGCEGCGNAEASPAPIVLPPAHGPAVPPRQKPGSAWAAAACAANFVSRRPAEAQSVWLAVSKKGASPRRSNRSKPQGRTDQEAACLLPWAPMGMLAVESSRDKLLGLSHVMPPARPQAGPQCGDDVGRKCSRGACQSHACSTNRALRNYRAPRSVRGSVRGNIRVSIRSSIRGRPGHRRYCTSNGRRPAQARKTP